MKTKLLATLCLLGIIVCGCSNQPTKNKNIADLFYSFIDMDEEQASEVLKKEGYVYERKNIQGELTQLFFTKDNGNLAIAYLDTDDSHIFMGAEYYKENFTNVSSTISDWIASVEKLGFNYNVDAEVNFKDETNTYTESLAVFIKALEGRKDSEFEDIMLEAYNTKTITASGYYYSLNLDSSPTSDDLLIDFSFASDIFLGN